jgi:uncharacterized oligopeptide transporter (OPT) family protein
MASSATGILVPGAIAAGVVAQSATGLFAFKTGHLVGAPWRPQVLALALGSVVGAVVSIPVFALLRDAYAIGGPDLPAPFAQTWAATTTALREGTSGIPDGAGFAALVAAGAGTILTLGSGPGLRRFLPSPTALGIGFLLPVAFAAPIVIGGVMATLVTRARPASADTVMVAGSGAILGEALLGTLVAGLGVAGLL